MFLITSRQILILILALFLAFPVWADKESAAQNYEKGLQAFNKGELDKAVIHLKNAIQQDENYLAAYVLLGKAHLKVGNGAGAEKELVRADRLGADKSLTLVPLADALLMQNKYGDVIERISASASSDGLNYQILLRRGEAHFELRQLDKARAAYEKAQNLKSNLPDAYLGIASVMIQEGRYGEAETQISRAMDFDTNSSSAWELKASIQYAQGRVPKAIEYYSRALTFQEDNLTALLGRTGAYLDTRQIELAQKDVDVLKEKFPLDPRGTYLQFLVLQRQGKSAEAQEALSKTYAFLEGIDIKALQSHAQLLMLAGVVTMELKQYEKAHEYFSVYTRKFAGELQAQKMFGKVLMARGDDREAVGVLESVLKANPKDYELLTLLGTAYANIRLYVKANEMFDKAIRIRGNASPARYQRALNELNFGNEEAAKKELQLIFDKANNVRAGFMLVNMHFQEKAMADAEVVARKLVTIQPQNPVARNLLAVALIETNKPGEARKNLEHVLKQEPDFFPAHMNIAKLDIQQGATDEAEARLNKLLEGKKNLSTIYIALSQIAERKDNALEAIRLAEKAYDADKKNIPAIIRLVELYLQHQKNKLALRVAEEASGIFPEELQVMELLGRSYTANEKPGKANGVYRNMVKLASYDSALLFDIARLQFEAADVESGIWSLRKAVEGDKEFIPARRVLIETLISTGDLVGAREHLKALKKTASKDIYNRLEGDWQFASKDFTQAVKYYRRAVKQTPNSNVVIRLAESLAASGKIELALKELGAWSNKNPDDISVKMALAGAYIQTNNGKKAGKLYEEVLERAPKNALALNNLANIYYENRDKRALSLAQQAQEINPEHPDYNDTLGWLLVESNKAREGLPYLRNAYARASSNPEIRYHIAAALHKLGRNDEALSELQALFSQKQQFPSRQAAEKLLEEIQRR